MVNKARPGMQETAETTMTRTSTMRSRVARAFATAFPALLATACTASLLAVVVAPQTAQAADQRRMGPAQRLLHNGAQPSQRDLARGQVRGASAIRTRGSTYDEVLSASESRYWQSKGKSRPATSRRQRRN